MLAELVLRVAADPNALKSLSSEELVVLLAEPEPPKWVFTEAAQRSCDEQVMAYLFTHPKAPPELLRRAVGTYPNRLERFQHHVAAHSGSRPTLKAVLSQVIPEGVDIRLSPLRQRLLAHALPPACLLRLGLHVGSRSSITVRRQRVKEALGDDAVWTPNSTFSKPPRSYSWAAQFLLLGDFLYYLTLKETVDVRGLPVLAKIALVLSNHQPIEPHLNDADVRVHLAAKERKSGTHLNLA